MFWTIRIKIRKYKLNNISSIWTTNIHSGQSFISLSQNMCIIFERSPRIPEYIPFPTISFPKDIFFNEQSYDYYKGLKINEWNVVLKIRNIFGITTWDIIHEHNNNPKNRWHHVRDLQRWKSLPQYSIYFLPSFLENINYSRKLIRIHIALKHKLQLSLYVSSKTTLILQT